MAAKTVKYSPNSIIYFKGDRSNSIYVLKQGKVSLNYKDLQTGQEVQDLIKTGEFFGVKAGLGHYIHDETAVVLQDSEVIQFSPSEFEALLKGNKRLIIQMLRVFSTQLRRIHRQVQGLLSSDLSGNPELGLFEIGEYYRKQKDTTKALAAYRRYQELHPRGYYIAQVEKALQSIDDGSFYHSKPSGDEPQEEALASVFVYSKHIDRGNYNEAFQGLSRLLKSSAGQEDRAEGEFQLGRCLYFMDKNTQAMQQLTSVVKNHPQHVNMGQVLYYLALSYAKGGQEDKAQGLMDKALAKLEPGTNLYQEAAKTLKQWRGEI